MKRVALLPALALSLVGASFAAETIRYSYDGRGRLVKVVRSGGTAGNTITNYSFDRAHNRTNKIVSGAP